MPHIARLFNLYGLAELCKLSMDEILGRVAEPLLNIIQCDQWQHALSYHVLVERDLEFESLYGDEWLFAMPPTNTTTTTTTTPTITTKSDVKIKKESRPLIFMPQKSPLYRWLSSNVNDLSAQKAKRQQQAIIETRQRQLAFATPTKSKKKIAGQLNPLPPSPPTKRKSSSYVQQQHTSTTTAKRQKTSSQPPMITIQNDTTRIDHGNDNLHLLATQAMQLRGLPPSPSPEPTFKNQRLPSLQTMLSELNQHRVVQFGERRNMDSCA
ncbi:hypothetical protein HMPREF1544_03689 [Mucor circinelloides 1006PhL]|uniref:Uncharacterized protein n=1 Tax=Mucor circinelloides f. circinelloides (strain 1006PhL) TaxID=1220926 RepID=S2K2K6_MUCC1|nr:hypothetical protein HMPREF1544_03689 [Mucor circinelloides 1006PhL]KAG1103780.1 hypothetical protein G6F42_017180 [Rhizopus arrhizus]